MVRDILQTKVNAVLFVSPETTVFDALVVMAEKNVGALLVMGGDTLVGIFSERDYTRKVELKGKTSKELRIREVMTSDPISVRPEQSIEECMEIMNSRHIRHLPVLENGTLIGMITIRDAIKAVISEKERTISQLENYIKGA
jgi:Predicted signal-transduction protein containing cAMP-binding and CBS domains